jgi:RHS repeat-associated protein
MSRRAVRAALSVVLGISLVTGVIAPAGAAPAAAEDEPVTKAAKPKSVRGSNYQIKPRTPDLAVDVVKTPAVVWPAAGKADVALPASTWAASLSGVQPKKAAGTLPVAVGPVKADGTAPSKVSVDLLGRRGASLLVKLTNPEKAKAAAKVSLELDYQAFRHAYGGDWATRLQLVQLPACATQTLVPAGCVGTPIPTRNTGGGKLSADVPSNGLFAMQAAAGGPAGDFGATQLGGSASWSVGGSSGDFNWQYPMRTPPGTGGPTATLALGYSSGSVDGRTSGTNNQTSWVGEGFELAPGGSVERKYASCAAKSEQSGNNGTRPVGDYCFATDNATFTLNGQGGELVRDDASGQWRPKADDGTKVERLYGAANGDEGTPGQEKEAGEHWLITTKDGTKFYFGLNKIPSPNAELTNSTWTVPVAGNHSGEQCNKPAFADSFCQQAYRWNLDYVVDVHGNTMSLFYDTETNNYGRNGSETSVSSYVRAGNIKRIDYGQKAGQVFTQKPVARVLFDTAQRCVSGSNCAPADFFDTPLDQECTSTTRCTKLGPSFWTKKKLTKVRTEVWRSTGFDPVDTWTLRHSFPNPGDNTGPRLWLEAITQTGEVGPSAVSTPEVNFDREQLNNRVADSSGYPLLDWFRIKAIHTGTGGELAITYSGKDCSLPGNVPAVDDNHRRCYPMKWTPPGSSTEREDWFHKYVVTAVTESDRVSGLQPVVTTVNYPEGPSWRHDDEDGLVEIGKKTWSQWRGYGRVVVTKGASNGPQTVTEHRYFQGMDGDKRKDGSIKNVEVEDSTLTKVEDVNALAGQERERSKLVGTAIVERTITDPWVSTATSTRVRSWATTQAFKVEEQAARQWEAKPGGGFRETSARNEYSTTGVLEKSTNAGDLATAADDTCTRYTYASNPTLGISELPTRTQTVAKACDQAWTKDDVVSDQLVQYAGGTTPTSAKPTENKRLSGFTGSTPVYETVATIGYDDHGRRETETDAKGRTTTYAYSPKDGPVTSTSVTLANGHVSSSELEPAWGLATSTTDVAERKTQSELDPLGRTAKVWLPGRAKTETANIEHNYFGGVDKAGVVQTRTLRADGSTETSYELFDGLQRKRQIQRPAADGIGRVITDIEYDSRGLQVIENTPYWQDAAPGELVFDPVEDDLPARKATTYDAVERPTKQAFWSFGEEKWATTHSHEPDRQTINPPTGEQATTKLTDVQGRQTELRTYNTPDPSANFDKTSYTYTPAGQLATVTDAAGNLWRYTYDLQGRRTKSEEPDRGTTQFGYNELDQVIWTIDARNNKLVYAYDLIGRPTTVREGSDTGPLRVERSYDTVAKGSPSTATRYVDGQAYVTRATGYTAAGQPTGLEVTIPAAQGGLAKTYAIGRTYTDTGQPKSVTMPGVGGLPAETLTTEYDSNDLPTTMSSEVSSYITATEFNSFGDLTGLEARPTDGKWLRHTYDYDVPTRRLTRAIIQRQTAGPQKIQDQTYSYDDGGNVTKIVETPGTGSTEVKDTQCFGYDETRRLTEAWTPGTGDCAAKPTAASQLGGPAPYWHSWTFDKIGNRKTEKRTTTAGVTTSTYEYPAAGQARPHAVQKVTTTGPEGTKVSDYGYDASGNQISRTLGGTAETFDWDLEGKLATVKKGSQQTGYIYDADGNRLLRKDSTGTTLYLGNTEILLKPDGSQVGTRYYTFGKQTIGVRVGDPALPNGKLTWLGSDHHGSASLTVDADTQTFNRRRITPYGETRGPVAASWPGERDFVGGTKDSSTGLVHLGAREYDPATGRFISVDPVVDPGDAQQLNAYAYANNNPTSMVDADGKRYRVEIFTELKTVVRWHIKQVRELQRQVITIYVQIVVFSIIAKIAAAFGFAQLAVRATALIAQRVTILKEVIKTVRYHTTEVIRITSKRFIQLSGDDAPEMAALRDYAKRVSFDNLLTERKVGQLYSAAKQAATRAKSPPTAADANRKQNEEQAKQKAEKPGGPLCAECQLDPDDDPIGKIGLATVFAGVGGVVGCAVTAGVGCVVVGAVAAATTAGGGVVWNRINGPKGQKAAEDRQTKIIVWIAEMMPR